MTNFNHLHKPKGTIITGTTAQITVGDIRDAIAKYPDDAEVFLGVCDCGMLLSISGFKDRGERAISFRVSSNEIEG